MMSKGAAQCSEEAILQDTVSDGTAPRGKRIGSMSTLGPLLLQGRDESSLDELVDTIQFMGTKAAIGGDLKTVQQIVESIKKAQCDDLIDLPNDDEGFNMLHYAICYEKIEIVNFLVSNGANVECTTKGSENDTPLMLAIRYYNPHQSNGVLGSLLECVDVNAHNASGITPLSLAVQMQNADVVKMLLNHSSIEVDKSNFHGHSALHVACVNESTEVTTLLLQKGANLFQKTAKGYIPIHITCKWGNVDMLQLLLQKGSDESKHCMLSARDNDGNTPILLAKRASKDVFNCLKEIDAVNMGAKNYSGDGILHMFSEDDDGTVNAQLLEDDKLKNWLHESNAKRETPLHVACQQGHWKSSYHFIEKGADCTRRSMCGHTPLMAAIAAGNTEVLVHLLNTLRDVEGVSYDDILSQEAMNGSSVTTWAIESNNASLLKALVEIDPHLATKVDTDTGRLPLHTAAASGSLLNIQTLLTNKHTCERLQKADATGKTPLMLAAENGHVKCVEVLHVPDGNQANEMDDSGFDLKAIDNEGHTALHLACLNGHYSVVEYLCTAGADLETCDQNSTGTPLACAASAGNVKILNYLIDKDANPNGGYKNENMKIKPLTPLILASQKGHEKCVHLLLEQPAIDVTCQNEAGYNCLAEAARNRKLEVALAIANSPHWKDALKGCNEIDETPIRLLIKYLPEVVEVILFRCIEMPTSNEGGIRIIFEYLDDFQELAKANVYPFPRAQNVTYESVEMHTLGPTTAELGPKTYSEKNHVLSWMAKHNCGKLLQHPVTHELISFKWRRYVMPMFLLNLAIYLVFVALLTAFALIMPLPEASPTCQDKGCNQTDPDQVILRLLSVIVLGFCGVRIVAETVQLLQRRLTYLTELDKYLVVPLLATTSTFVAVAQGQECFCSSSFQWQIGALAVFLGWIDLLLFFKKFPYTAVPIYMLQNIVSTFLHLLYLPLVLILAFALPFYMLLAVAQDNSFHTPALSLLKTMVMISGEFDYETIFQLGRNATEEPNDIHYAAMTYALWIVFVIVMPVLFINLLIGLAVGDTQEVREKAQMTFLTLQVTLALEIENSLPSCIRRWLKKSFHVVKTNASSLFFLRWVFGNNKYRQLEEVYYGLKSDKTLKGYLEGVKVLEPIEEVKNQVQKNMAVFMQVKDTGDQFAKDITRLTEQNENLLNAIQELKKEMKKKRSKIPTIFKKFLPSVKKKILNL